jgi:hypothetical protein
MATADIEQSLQEIKTLIENNTIKKEDLRTEVQKVLEKEIGKVDKRMVRFETEFQKKIRNLGINQLEMIESMILANQLVIHLIAPPACLLLLMVTLGIKNGNKIDGWNLLKNPGEEIVKLFKINRVADLSDTTPLKKGMTVAGYPVTSGKGYRIHPNTGKKRYHNGVDIATPVGVKVYAFEDMKVKCLYQQNGAGKYAVVQGSTKIFTLMHLDSCTPGNYKKGQSFAKTGETGLGTGPHLHIEQRNKKGFDEIASRGYVTAFLNPDYGNDQDQIKLAIGNAEGTLNPDGTKTKHWDSHVDPGNAARNQGTFSYQHPASSPQDADKKQLAKLEKVKKDMLAENPKLTKLELLNGLDLFNQSEAAAIGYVARLKASSDKEKTRIITARIGGFYTENGKLDAPGFGNNFLRLHDDQVRRYEKIEAAVK